MIITTSVLFPFISIGCGIAVLYHLIAFVVEIKLSHAAADHEE
jgi:hypothetical protein